MSNEKDFTNNPRCTKGDFKPAKDRRYKGRLHLVELYLDSDKWQSAYDKLVSMDDVAYIHHNKDEGKKEHVHAIIRTKNPTWSTSICNQLGIEDRFIEQCNKLDNAFRYLIHATNNAKDKYQYDESEVMFTSIKMQRDFLQALDTTVELNETEKVLGILDLLDSIDECISYTQFVRLACQNGYYDALRRANYLMTKILDEHNTRINQIKYNNQIKEN